MMFPRIEEVRPISQGSNRSGGGSRPNSGEHQQRGLGGRTLGVQHPHQSQVRMRTMLLAHTSHSLARKKQSQLNPELYSQFIYFRKEFIEACTASQVTIPLEMLEDSTERVFAFIQLKGPSHVFQVMRSNSENVNILRVSCSLLIVTLTILQCKYEIEDKIEKHHEKKNVRQFHVKKSGGHTLAAWLRDQLHEICDSSSIQIVVQILKYSNKLSVNELLLSLIAKIVVASKEAALQMILSVPSSKKKTNASKENIGGILDGGSSVISKGSANQSKSGNNLARNSVTSASSSVATTSGGGKDNDDDEINRTCLAYVFSTYACNRNKEVIMAATADILIGTLITLQNEANFEKICEDVARTTVTQLPLLKTKTSGKSTRKKVMSQLIQGVSNDSTTSVVPEVHVAVKGHAETKLSVHIIDKEGREGIGHSKGDLTVAPSKPIAQKEVDRAIGGLKDTPFTLSQFKSDAFCDITEMDTNLYISSAEIKHAKKLAIDDLVEKRKKPLKVPGEETDVDLNRDNEVDRALSKGTLKDVEWAVLKLLLKFMQRFMKYTGYDMTEATEPKKLSETTEASLAFKQANQPSTQKKTLMYAFSKVLNSVCLLIINSDSVAKFINTLAGVESMIKKSGGNYSSNSSEYVLVQDALVFLKLARTVDRSGERQGTLCINLISCQDLHTEDDDVSDPFVQFTCGKTIVKSKRMNNNLNPIFNELFRIPWDSESPLIVEVLDYDGTNEAEPLGDLNIDLQGFDFKDGKIIHFKNRKLQNIDTGTITIEISYKPLPGHKAPDGTVNKRSTYTNNDLNDPTERGRTMSMMVDGSSEKVETVKRRANSESFIRNSDGSGALVNVGPSFPLMEDDEDSATGSVFNELDDGSDNMIEMPVLQPSMYSPEREVGSMVNDKDDNGEIVNNRPSFGTNTTTNPAIVTVANSESSDAYYKPWMATKNTKSPYISDGAGVDERKPRTAPKSPLKPIPKTATSKSRPSSVSDTRMGMSLDRDFFNTLRSVPQLPRTLSASTVLNPDDEMATYLSRSLDKQNVIMKQAMKTVEKEGGFHDGKHSRSIMSRAEDVYLNAFPKEKPKPPALQVAVKKVDNVTEKGNDKITAEAIQMDGTAVERPFFIDDVDAEAINKFFLFPDLFEFQPSQEEKIAAAAEKSQAAKTKEGASDNAVELPPSFEAIDAAAEVADALHKQILEESAVQENVKKEKSEIFVMGDDKDKLEGNVGPDIEQERRVQAKFIISQDFIYPS